MVLRAMSNAKLSHQVVEKMIASLLLLEKVNTLFVLCLKRRELIICMHVLMAFIFPDHLSNLRLKVETTIITFSQMTPLVLP
jgi:hypothetical protein